MDAASNCERLRCCHVAEANRVEHHSGERDLAGICPQPSIVPCGVAAKRRKFALLAASCLAPLSFGLSEPALAQCTPLDASGNASCTGTFNTNINYNTNNTPINLTLQAPVTVVSPGGDAVNAANTAPSPLPAGPGPTSSSLRMVRPSTILPILVAITRADCEYSPAATPSLRQRTPQLI